MKLSLFFPVSPPNVNQGFGVNGEYYRANGINIKGHNGIDFKAYHGQPVYAPMSGTAFYEIDSNGGDGVVIVSNQQFDAPITGQCYYKSILWHLCDPGKEPKYASPIFKALGGANSGKGIQVKVGDLIGYADSTGLSTGDHLHFGLKPVVGGTPSNVGDAADVKAGDWVSLYADNEYLGAIDPTPYFNGYFAPQANEVISLLKMVAALMQRLLLKL